VDDDIGRERGWNGAGVTTRVSSIIAILEVVPELGFKVVDDQ
jgi:hypothetical protein